MDTDLDGGDFWRARKDLDDQRKQRNLEKADPDGWEKHTQWHWSRDLNGHRLDYWPSRNKFQYQGKTICGDVKGFIRNREAPTQ